MGRPYLDSPIWRNGASSVAQGVALRVDKVEVVRLPADLPGHEEVNVEPEIVFIQSRLVHVSNGPHLFAHDPGSVVHGRGRGKTLALVKVAAQQREDRLRTGEVPAGQEDEDAVPRINDRMHLLADVDLVETGVRPRVGGHHEPLAHDDAQAIRQSRLRSQSLRVCLFSKSL